MRNSGTWSLLGAGLAAALVLAGLAQSSPARETLPGPVPARVIEVIDGDTLMVRAKVWIGQEIEIKVRLEGVDAPELGGGCERERTLAQRARALIMGKIRDGKVLLNRVQYGKYAGRVVARVETSAGEDLSAALLAANLARAYRGGRRRSWCDRADGD